MTSGRPCETHVDASEVEEEKMARAAYSVIQNVIVGDEFEDQEGWRKGEEEKE